MTTWTTNTISTSNNGFNNSNYTMSTATLPNSIVSINQDENHALEVKGNIVMNGRNLEERLTTIEHILMIPERDVELEKKYPKIKKMYEDYINELKKYKMWEKIKE